MTANPHTAATQSDPHDWVDGLLLRDAGQLGVIDVMNDGALDVIVQAGEHFVRFALERDERVLLGDAAQTDATAQFVECGQVAHPQLVDGIEHDEPLEQAVRKMIEHDASHLIVVDRRTGKAVGVVSTLDVAGVLAWGLA